MLNEVKYFVSKLTHFLLEHIQSQSSYTSNTFNNVALKYVYTSLNDRTFPLQ